MAYKCMTCGETAESPGHLCNPCDDKTKCNFCGMLNVDVKHICKGQLESIKFACKECGRVAVEEKYLCKPYRIEAKAKGQCNCKC